MNVVLAVGARSYAADLARAVSIAAPVAFDGERAGYFGATPASARPYQAGGFVGDTRRGGSCNVPVLRVNPHCDGTHTESVGHILDIEVPLPEVAPAALVAATLITVAPVPAVDTRDDYEPALEAEDRVLTRDQIERALLGVESAWCKALVIRTRRVGKGTSDERAMPFFTASAMRLLAERGVEHLLVDFPSLDRMHDEGLLTAHHLFWDVSRGARNPTETTRRGCTVTESITVPDELADGRYLLSLQLPAFALHVAPSRPLLIPVEAR